VSISILKDGEKILREWKNTVIILTFAYQQPQRLIKSRLKKAKKIFSGKHLGKPKGVTTNTTEPVLYINNKIAPKNRVETKLQDLRPDEILYIEIKKKPEDNNSLEVNVKNYIVKIWTKKQMGN
jgi:hypothetical protein